MVDGVGTTHHIKLGAYHLMLEQGSYRKRAAPAFGARFTTGDPNYNNLSMWQHWAQTCWIGGMGAPDWIDDAMFDAGVGVDTINHEVAVLARDMGRGAVGWTVGGDSNRVRRFAIHLGILYCLNVSGVDDAILYKYTASTDTWAAFKTFTGKTAGSLCSFDGDLFVGTSGTVINRYNGSAWSTITKPDSLTDVPSMMYAFRERLYVGLGRKIYRLKPDNTWDGSAVFFDGVGVDTYVDATYHLGFLYFLSANGHVVRTDGNVTFDIWQWDGQVTATGLSSYDGRLFVGTFEYTDDAAIGEGVIYQFSGAAVTELKRWGRIGRATSPGRFTVAHRRLFYGASDLLGISSTYTGFGITCYDSAEDAHSIFASNRNNVTYADGLGNGKSWQVDDVVYYQGYLIASVRGHGLFKTRLQTRDVSRYVATYDTTAAGAVSGSDNGGWLTSSDYDASTPGLMKLWRRITVHCDLPSTATTVLVSYSLDGGVTWVSAGTVKKTLTGTVARTSGQATLTGTGTNFLGELHVGDSIVVGADTRTVATITSDTALTVSANWSQTGSGATCVNAATRFAQSFYLENVRGTRLKYKIQLDSTDSTRSPQVRGVIVSYLPQPEPNWAWEFTVLLAEDQELLDGTDRLNINTAPIFAALEGYWRSQQLVYFQDVDQSEWQTSSRAGVLVTDFTEDKTFIGPTSDGVHEGRIRLSLLEAVEAY